MGYLIQKDGSIFSLSKVHPDGSVVGWGRKWCLQHDISSSWVEMRMHKQIQLSRLPASAFFGGVVIVIVMGRKQSQLPVF